MELFREDGCLTDEGLRALTGGRLDELGRLEAAEHLAYCDRCLDRYTALLTADALETPPRDISRPVGQLLWVRLMRSVWGRMAVAGVAAALALTAWGSGALDVVLSHGASLETYTPAEISPPAVSYPEPPRPGGRTAPAQKAYEAVSGLWEALTDTNTASEE